MLESDMIEPDLEFEKSLWKKGCKIVIGIDEVGRGPLADPVCAGGVTISSETQVLPGVRDSKTLSLKQREDLFEKIMNVSDGWGVGFVSANDIDCIGIQFAIADAMRQVVDQIEARVGSRADYLIIDGASVIGVDGYSMTKKNKGDLMHYSIAAGSILAKVMRDRLMTREAEQYPEYGFEKHVGYGTAVHMSALRDFGPCELHRRSFKPVGDLIIGANDEQKNSWRYWRASRFSALD